MRTILPGEEVRYRGQRWMVSRVDPARMNPYRLLKSGPSGTEVRWVPEAEIARIDTYVTPVQDTARA